MPQVRPLICFVSVVQEGQALIDLLHLELTDEHDVKLYSHPNQMYHLIVMGIGREAAQQASAYASNRWGTQCAAWVNFGIAGHGEYPVGTLYQIAEVTDEDGTTHQKTNGHIIPGIEQAALKTFTHFVESRPATHLCDMEGYWLAHAHSRLDGSVPLYLLKVISDNTDENLLTSEGGKSRLAEYLREHAQYLVRTLKDILAKV